MLLVGVSILAFYSLLSYGSYVLLVTLWRLRPDPVTAGLVVGATAVLFGYASLRFGTRRLLSRLDARELPRSRYPGVYGISDRLAAEMSVDTPRILVTRLPVPNAFALDTAGRDTVVLDAALFRLLDREEFEGLLAHELAHLESKDSLVQTLTFTTLQTAVGLVSLLVAPPVFLVTGLALAAAWVRGDPRSWPRTLPGRLKARIEEAVSVLMVGITLLARAHSRRREFAADDRAAEVTGRPLALARALRKIERTAEPRFGLLSPLWVYGEVESEEERTLRDLFSTHPRTEDRVERLRSRADSGRVEVEVR
ncbi:M48 family metallopeptidase [Halopelagius fulvigenes]|uniref:M48 family metallopeptidase n=1 Tax=Halopelagius fulvigenes TaxID=1198324 RepID=A0ABD5TWE1_9EURY